MQKTVYICDHCSEVIGQNAHVSLHVASNGSASGIAVPPGVADGGVMSPRWRVRGFDRVFLHLHIACVGPYFKEIVRTHIGKAPVTAPKKK